MTLSPSRIDDCRFMAEALDRAKAALDRGEFPVGCVIVLDGTVAADGGRTGSAETIASEITHAEINALTRFEQDHPMDVRGRAVLYTTLEPCLMCFGAILIAGIGRVVYAYEDVMGGGTKVDRTTLPPLYRDSRTVVTPGVLRDESRALFREFFSRPGETYLAGTLLANHALGRGLKERP